MSFVELLGGPSAAVADAYRIERVLECLGEYPPDSSEKAARGKEDEGEETGDKDVLDDQMMRITGGDRRGHPRKADTEGSQCR
ncbi:hypothetical protein ACSSS7_005601 [Eimeria intestinalis]